MAAIIFLFLTFSAVCALYTGIGWARYYYHRRSSKASACPQDEKTTQSPPTFKIQPLTPFDWQTTEPEKHRPYKPKYNLTMSIEKTTLSDLLAIDNTYLDRITLRRQIMADHEETVLAANDASLPAIQELYTWMVGTYLPTRYPDLFVLVSSPSTSLHHPSLYNKVTDESYPVALDSSTSGVEILRTLGGLVEDDLLFLLPSSDGDGYALQAFVTCFPNGFDTRRKLGLKLRDIHTPVPGYAEKLAKSMDRWFDRLEVGTVVRRFNWTVQPHDRLFAPSGNHLYEGDDVQPIEAEIDRSEWQTYVRTERQFVHRLPRTRAVLFSFKTYLYPIRDIKAEGLGETLAQAIDGLQGGNVPGMYYYKRAAVWGDSVQRYLRS
ncbi:hypothetical protein P170DRAFT_461118 [Aspergillus steynii IBT 23096]|uniref:HRQ family protein 2 n=1 Tax=Aspergillus steynii IBT 23096 TaxID=1392250 RepID=A0A2I2GQP2_9EURO|nr:uncharacterized protein P170DRAFT_461118 [Aspergillus steynii IBT 23096]PLB55202.1 hypothetical protein P170DRAFT_461118 [Aspergillus steynii IBT 23096]